MVQSYQQESKHGIEVRHEVADEYKSRIDLARRQPRDLKVALKRCVDEAELSGDLFYYNWSVKTKRADGSQKLEVIEGPSYPLAKSALRNFGNCDAGMLPVQETQNAWIFTGRFIDLETNSSITRQFRQDKKHIVYGKIDEARKEDIRFQIGQSKCLRNVILAGIPEALTEKMMTVAKTALRNKIDDRIERAKRKGGGIETVKEEIIAAFEKYSITKDMIEKKFDLPFKAWDAETLTRLSGDLSALQHNSETPDTLYPELNTNGSPDKEKPEEKPENGLSEDQMQTGDASTHQSHELNLDDKDKTDKKKNGKKAGF
jgi:hypothetical protein